MSASVLAARGNVIFPVETFGDTLIVLPKGDKAGFGDADFRVECGRVSAALRDPHYKNLVLDFSLTNYVGGNVVKELQRWVTQTREQGGRAVACEVSGDMRKGLEVSRTAEDWEFFETRDDALKTVATETVGQTLARWTPTIATVVTVLLLIGLGAWLLSGRHVERRHFAELESIWADYAKIRKQYATVQEWREHTPPLVERLDQEIDELQALLHTKYAARTTMLSVAKKRMKPILLDPRSPDPRARGVEAGFAYIRANLAGLPKEQYVDVEEEYRATRPTLAGSESDDDLENGDDPESDDDPEDGDDEELDPEPDDAEVENASAPAAGDSGASMDGEVTGDDDQDDEAQESPRSRSDDEPTPIAEGRSPD
ncbi:hypothetical protein [Alienimonas chondri]|uniref:STAS domain-containing protein n=1 Tax=Alienimonas chondri TaxID=2681879 RepID=A0ABX1VDR0_9PLAN|nr:hypothetical protein [Alienimonas chondri]NNJ25201.1 hypothetical protein [Alienimonas chondri]